MSSGLRRPLAALSSCIAVTALIAAALPVVAEAAQAPYPRPSSVGIIVKMRPGADRGPRLNGVMQRFGVGVQGMALAPQGVFLMRANDPAVSKDPVQSAALAGRIASNADVEFAEPNLVGGLLTGLGFHAWPDGPPAAVGTNPALWSNQQAATALRLDDAHRVSQGDGVRVAVIDTGVDATHPALAGKVRSGWDFIDDDATTGDPRTGVDSNGDGVPDEAAGHGTFVAGTVALVAPHARLLAYRVLDSDGLGTTYDAAEAVTAATDAGAKVINLSFGTPGGVPSRVLTDAIGYARSRGAVVVGAAGNTGNATPTYPAVLPSVLSVSALAADEDNLASFSSRGGWVKVAAPGEAIVGPVPGGGFARWSGTSVAAPFVSGQAALVLALDRRGNSSSVSDKITRTTDRLTRNEVAYGAIDVVRSVWPLLSIPVVPPLRPRHR